MTGLRRVRGERRWLRRCHALAGVIVLAGTIGCHHRRVQPVVLPPQTPVALIEVPPPAEPLVEAQTPKLPAVPTAANAAKPKKTKKRAVKSTSSAAQSGPATVPASPAKAAPGETGAATSTPPPASPKTDAPVTGLGALTVGGEQSPHALQEANDLIASNERRLSGLGAETVRLQAELIGKVRNFQKEAQLALSTGDADGAKTLATKGKLLLDDMEKAR